MGYFTKGASVRLLRDCLTGELKELPSEGGGRKIIFRGATPPVTGRRRQADPYDNGKEHVDRGMSLKPEDATPERVAHENEQCKRHATGAWYDLKGLCHTPTRGSRAREMARPHGPNQLRFQDNDGGYGDCCGR